IRQEILSIDPNTPIEGAGPAAPPRPPEPASDIPGLVEIEPEAPSIETPPPADTTIPGLETGALPGDVIESLEVTGFEPTGEPVLDDIDVSGTEVEGLETTTFDFGEVDTTSSMADSGFDLPLLGDDDDEEPTPLPTLDVDEPAPPRAAAPPPASPSDPLAGDLRIDLNALGFSFPG